MDKNIYQAPEAELIVDEGVSEAVLASRWSRLGAALLDTLLLTIIVFSVMYIIGWFDIIMQGEELNLTQNLLLGLLGIVCFAVVNFKLLESAGQTIGKKALGIKIVAIDGKKALMSNHMLKRYCLYFLPNQVPVGGAAFQLINLLFIFGANKQCLHDVIAKTKVVVV